MKVLESIKFDRLVEILGKMDSIKVGILGDICLDVYWHADMRKSELSLETPHYMLPVVKERMSPGGGANVAANMAALNPKRVTVFGAIGDDWRGKELIQLLSKLGIKKTGIVTGLKFSNAYIKPMRNGISNIIYEDPRIDFVSHEPVSKALEDDLILAIEKAANNLDVLCVSDQLPFGVVTERVRECICELARQGLRVVVDSRYNIGMFTNVILKPNAREAAVTMGIAPEIINSLKDFENVSKELSIKTGCDVFLTIGDKGSVYVSKNQMWHIPAYDLNAPIDICGAGDSSLSGFGLSLAAGAEPWEAAYIAGLCSEVTIQQIGITGTATRDQILNCHKSR